MKCVTLNLWGGRVREEYGKFFQKHTEVDVWCFQEVFRAAHSFFDLHLDITKIDRTLTQTLEGYVPEHNHYFCEVLEDFYGISSWIHKDHKIVDSGTLLVAKGEWHDNPDKHNRDHDRKALWLVAEYQGKHVMIMNIHFTHRPEGKQDSEKRIKQSQTLIDFLATKKYPTIIMGDFNLLPDTESIAMIERAGYRNLVKEFNVSSTRTSLYQKPLRFADYIFVSPEIRVNHFEVLQDVVSDHHPLLIDFDVY